MQIFPQQLPSQLPTVRPKALLRNDHTLSYATATALFLQSPLSPEHRPQPEKWPRPKDPDNSDANAGADKPWCTHADRQAQTRQQDCSQKSDYAGSVNKARQGNEWRGYSYVCKACVWTLKPGPDFTWEDKVFIDLHYLHTETR